MVGDRSTTDTATHLPDVGKMVSSLPLQAFMNKTPTQLQAFWKTLQHSAKATFETSQESCLPGFTLLIRKHTEAFQDQPAPENDDEMSELNVKRVNLRGIVASITSASQAAELNPQVAIQIMGVTKAFSSRVSVAEY